MSVSTIQPIQEILHRWILAGQALVGSVGALAFIAAFRAMTKKPCARYLAREGAPAAAHASTRSATIRDVAEAALGEGKRLLADRMSELDGHATRHGGNVVEELKAGRPD